MGLTELLWDLPVPRRYDTIEVAGNSGIGSLCTWSEICRLFSTEKRLLLYYFSMLFFDIFWTWSQSHDSCMWLLSRGCLAYKDHQGAIGSDGP